MNFQIEARLIMPSKILVKNENFLRLVDSYDFKKGQEI